jgi:5-oxoprolinase (ATP-hydrolysing) subunit A
VDRTMPILAISGTVLEDMARSMGLAVYSEIFADRGYLPNGQLVPRKQPGALLRDESVVIERMIAFLRSGVMPTVGGPPIRLQAHSICVHGDNPAAVALARSLRDGLNKEGIRIQPFLSSHNGQD